MPGSSIPSHPSVPLLAARPPLPTPSSSFPLFRPHSHRTWPEADPFQHGEIVDIRFPSHSVNARRRFAYIQFRSFAEAQAASAALDGTSADEEGKLKLVAKLSNPDHKAKRSDQGATAKRQAGIHEGREVYVSNVDWSAEEKEVKEVFEKYGAVERVRIPRGREGKSKGMAFVVFKQKVSLLVPSGPQHPALGPFDIYFS